MIEQVQGTLTKKLPTYCVINCHGIGIGIHISLNTYQNLADENELVQLLTHLHVREDALQLFGFMEESERNAFQKLINVSGVGPRLAMTILSGLTVEDFSRAVAVGDHDMLTKIPGVGKKTAQRVVLELKEKIELGEEVIGRDLRLGKAVEHDNVNEAIRALLTLGYKQVEAKQTIEKVPQKFGKDIALEDLIKYALKEI